MKAQLYANLEEAIQKWADENCEDFDFFWGNDTVKYMSQAAAAVLEATSEAQESAKDEGYLKAA